VCFYDKHDNLKYYVDVYPRYQLSPCCLNQRTRPKDSVRCIEICAHVHV